MVTTLIRPATVCGYSPRMRLDVVVNLLTMQALKNGAMTVLGGDQTRPNIHIDDLVDLYLFAIDRRLAGVFNAGFENISVRDIAEAVTRDVPAWIETPSNDPRSYSVCSDKLLATGFAPSERSRRRFAKWSSRIVTAGWSMSPFVTMCAGCASTTRMTECASRSRKTPDDAPQTRPPV